MIFHEWKHIFCFIEFIYTMKIISSFIRFVSLLGEIALHRIFLIDKCDYKFQDKKKSHVLPNS